MARIVGTAEPLSEGAAIALSLADLPSLDRALRALRPDERTSVAQAAMERWGLCGVGVRRGTKWAGVLMIAPGDALPRSHPLTGLDDQTVGLFLVHIDPGSSFADPGATQIDPGLSLADPGAAQIDPGSASPGPGAARVDFGADGTNLRSAFSSAGAVNAGSGIGRTGPDRGRTGPGASRTGPGVAYSSSGAGRADSGAGRADSGAVRADSGAGRTGPGSTYFSAGPFDIGSGADFSGHGLARSDSYSFQDREDAPQSPDSPHFEAGVPRPSANAGTHHGAGLFRTTIGKRLIVGLTRRLRNQASGIEAQAGIIPTLTSTFTPSAYWLAQMGFKELRYPIGRYRLEFSSLASWTRRILQWEPLPSLNLMPRPASASFTW